MSDRKMLAPMIFFAILALWAFYSLHWELNANLPRLITLVAAGFAAGVCLALAVAHVR